MSVVVAVLLALMVAGSLALALVVVLRSRLKRFVMSLKCWKAEFRVEIDADTSVVQPPLTAREPRRYRRPR